MKRLLQLFALAFTIFNMNPVFSEAYPQDQEYDLSYEKTYVLSEQVLVSNEGIFVNLDNDWVKTDALFSDEIGIYIYFTPQEMGCREGFFPCRRCDRCVKWYYDICPHCKKPT